VSAMNSGKTRASLDLTRGPFEGNSGWRVIQKTAQREEPAPNTGRASDVTNIWESRVLHQVCSWNPNTGLCAGCLPYYSNEEQRQQCKHETDRMAIVYANRGLKSIRLHPRNFT
jgi:hypothetical protein